MKARSTPRTRAAAAGAALLAAMLLPGAAALAADAKSSATSATDSRSEAAALLKAMASYLSGLRNFSFNSQNSFEVVQANGQKVEFGKSRIVSVARPNRLR